MLKPSKVQKLRIRHVISSSLHLPAPVQRGQGLRDQILLREQTQAHPGGWGESESAHPSEHLLLTGTAAERRLAGHSGFHRRIALGEISCIPHEQKGIPEQDLRIAKRREGIAPLRARSVCYYIDRGGWMGYIWKTKIGGIPFGRIPFGRISKILKMSQP